MTRPRPEVVKNHLSFSCSSSSFPSPIRHPPFLSTISLQVTSFSSFFFPEPQSSIPSLATKPAPQSSFLDPALLLLLVQELQIPESDMGFPISFTICVFVFVSITKSLTAQNQTTNPSNTSAVPNPPPQPGSFLPLSPPPSQGSNIAPFRPSIAVIVGVLTTMFSITFLLLLYAKHCKRNASGGTTGYGGNPNSGVNPLSARRNSGIDRSVIESLPIFRFGSLRGQKEGLECAVCLNVFDSTEVLRLLPKCKHAFHVECVDTWLDAHSTCPLCRYRVEPEDVLLIEELEPQRFSTTEQDEEKPRNSRRENENQSLGEVGYRRISGRHSSAGENSSFRNAALRPSCANARRSADHARRTEQANIGCFDSRKDGLLLTEPSASPETDHRFEHQIIVSDAAALPRRWSDLKPSDVLFLRSEMIITDSGRYSLSCARASTSSSSKQQPSRVADEIAINVADDNSGGDGRNAINSRCVSEITGLSRFRREEEEKAVKRWLGFRTPRWLTSTESSGSGNSWRKA